MVKAFQAIKDGRANSALFAGLLALAAGSPAHAMESRSFVVGWFSQATNSTDHDCPDGVHPEIELQFIEDLKPLDYSPAEVAEYRRKLLANEDSDLFSIMGMRGRVDGEPVNPYTNPATVADPKLPPLEGDYAYGFDLDGRGAEAPNAFEDPETHEAGVDHEMYRALGCARSFRGSLEGRPTYWAWAWGQTKESQPAWLVTVSADDLTADGPATVTFERAIEHLESNSDGSPRADMTYRVDPDPRSENKFAGEIKDGELWITDHKKLRMLQNPLVAPELELANTHMRLEFQDEKTVRGFVGGYQPWEPIYFGFGAIGLGGEMQVTGDIPALYYLLKQHADADPDPETGMNRAISVTYYFEAVPAFVMRPDEQAREAALH